MFKDYGGVKSFKRAPYLKKKKEERRLMGLLMYDETKLSKAEIKRALKARQLNLDLGYLDVREKIRKTKRDE